MKHHYLAVVCGCGARRVIGIGAMALDRRLRYLTLATVVLKLSCPDCHDGPDEVHLTATSYGLDAPEYGGGLIWTMLLYQRRVPGSLAGYHRRVPPGPVVRD